MMAQNDNICMTLPAKAKYIEVVRLALYGVAVRMGFAFEDIEDLKVAVGEACNNVVLHAYGDEQDAGLMTVVFEAGRDGLIITVADEGKSFTPKLDQELTHPFADAPLEDMKAGGLGLYLMQALVDQVEISSESGTKVTLTKYLEKSGVVL